MFVCPPASEVEALAAAGGSRRAARARPRRPPRQCRGAGQLIARDRPALVNSQSARDRKALTWLRLTAVCRCRSCYPAADAPDVLPGELAHLPGRHRIIAVSNAVAHALRRRGTPAEDRRDPQWTDRGAGGPSIPTARSSTGGTGSAGMPAQRTVGIVTRPKDQCVVLAALGWCAPRCGWCSPAWSPRAARHERARRRRPSHSRVPAVHGRVSPLYRATGASCSRPAWRASPSPCWRPWRSASRWSRPRQGATLSWSPTEPTACSCHPLDPRPGPPHRSGCSATRRSPPAGRGGPPHRPGAVQPRAHGGTHPRALSVAGASAALLRPRLKGRFSPARDTRRSPWSRSPDSPSSGTRSSSTSRWKPSIRSILPVCDEVVVNVGPVGGRHPRAGPLHRRPEDPDPRDRLGHEPEHGAGRRDAAGDAGLPPPMGHLHPGRRGAA